MSDAPMLAKAGSNHILADTFATTHRPL